MRAPSHDLIWGIWLGSSVVYGILLRVLVAQLRRRGLAEGLVSRPLGWLAEWALGAAFNAVAFVVLVAFMALVSYLFPSLKLFSIFNSGMLVFVGIWILLIGGSLIYRPRKDPEPEDWLTWGRGEATDAKNSQSDLSSTR
jgi:hypothetical protein